ncbi:MAG TPA: thioredoxin family protein [Bacillales bacterium]|nr:thioredoxin family protein [Bacillales bacterium]
MEKIDSIQTFESVIQQDKPTIVKFEAGWCPDCKRMDMFIGDIVEEHNDIDWYELNRDEFPELADQYEVMGIPSLLVFKNGEKTAHLHSAHAKTSEQVQSFLKTL